MQTRCGRCGRLIPDGFGLCDACCRLYRERGRQGAGDQISGAILAQIAESETPREIQAPVPALRFGIQGDPDADWLDTCPLWAYVAVVCTVVFVLVCILFLNGGPR